MSDNYFTWKEIMRIKNLVKYSKFDETILCSKLDKWLDYSYKKDKYTGKNLYSYKHTSKEKRMLEEG